MLILGLAAAIRQVGPAHCYGVLIVFTYLDWISLHDVKQSFAYSFSLCHQDDFLKHLLQDFQAVLSEKFNVENLELPLVNSAMVVRHITAMAL